MKRCSTCKTEKPVTEFTKNVRGKGGLHNVCGPCQRQYNKTSYRKNRSARLIMYKAYKAKNIRNGLCMSGCGAPLHYSNKSFCLECAAQRQSYSSHGVALDGRLMLYARQNGACAICFEFESDPMKLHVDHDHKTGLLRGMLCRSCNTGLGSFRDDPIRIAAAKGYISERAGL